MGICDWCELEMTDEVPCTLDTYHRQGVPFPRLPYQPDYETERCHDCKTPVGEQHHPGCDTEICPVCGGQGIACGCWFDEDGADHHPDFVITVEVLIEQLSKCDPTSRVSLSRWGEDIPIRRVDCELNGTVFLNGHETGRSRS